MDKTSPEYRTRYRATLNKLIDDIIVEIPTDVQHISLFTQSLDLQKETLAYTAPEILDNSVLALLNGHSTTVCSVGMMMNQKILNGL